MKQRNVGSAALNKTTPVYRRIQRPVSESKPSHLCTTTMTVFTIGITGLKLRDFCKHLLSPIEAAASTPALVFVCDLSIWLSKLPARFAATPLNDSVLMTDTRVLSGSLTRNSVREVCVGDVR